MAFEITDTYELVETLDRLEPISTYWLDLCFPRIFTSQSEHIIFDQVDKAKRLAPFVAPNVQGQPMLARRQNIKMFSPAYIKPKDKLDPARNLIRRAGERIGGSLTVQQRHDAIVAETLSDHRDMIWRRWEWMACEAVVKGQVTVAGENYPSVTVGFGRKATHTKTLVGTAGWNQPTTATPITDIQAWVREIFLDSGRVVDRITMTPSALSAFMATDQVKALLDTRRGSQLSIETARVTAESSYPVFALPDGGPTVWSYFETYEDNMGVQVPFVADGTVVLTGSVEGVRCFGAIMDDEAGWAPLPIFPKMWKENDPSGVILMTQSAPLMIPLRPDATMSVDVLS